MKSILARPGCILFAMITILTYLIQQPACAETVRFTQKIYPEGCMPTVIIGFGGSVTYSFPPGCGEPVYPSSPSAPVRTPVSSFDKAPLSEPSEQAVTKLFFGGKSTYLESNPGSQLQDGYMLVAGLYGQYSFYLPGDARAGNVRSFQIVRIGDQSIDVQFWPGGKLYTLQRAKSTELNIGYGAETDLALRFQQVNPDGTVLLHVYFPFSHGSLGIAQQNQYAYVASLFLILTGAIMLYMYATEWYTAQRRLPADTWWLSHTHERLAGNDAVNPTESAPEMSAKNQKPK